MRLFLDLDDLDGLDALDLYHRHGKRDDSQRNYQCAVNQRDDGLIGKKFKIEYYPLRSKHLKRVDQQIVGGSDEQPISESCHKTREQGNER